MFQAKEVKYEQKIKGKDRGFQLKKVSFSMEDGYFLALLGENGAGKSTLLRVLNGMVEAETGQICMDAWSASMATISCSYSFLILQHSTSIKWGNVLFITQFRIYYSGKGE